MRRDNFFQGDTISNELDKEVACRHKLQNFRDEFSAWRGEVVYLNRFYLSRNEIHEFNQRKFEMIQKIVVLWIIEHL